MILSLLSIMWSQWILIFLFALYLIYKWSTYTFDHFEKKNVEYETPLPLVGNLKEIVLRKESLFKYNIDIYRKYKHKKFIGTFQMRVPVLNITDPEILKQVTVKDFECFLNHRTAFDPKVSSLFGHSLFSLNDQKWKDMRAILSPAFTGSKMRLMFQLIDESARQASQYLQSRINNDQPLEVDLKDYFTRFTNDVIATCAFGVTLNSFHNQDNDFYQMARKATDFSGVRFLLISLFSGILKHFNVQIFDKNFIKYFYDLVLGAMKFRVENSVVRPDMINLLMEAQKGTLKASNMSETDAAEGYATAQESEIGQKQVNRKLTDEELVAQCFIFFTAGFDTVSVLLCFGAHELMENPHVQNKLIEEVDHVREELAGKPLTYEALQKMKYLDMVISETLRKWPPALGTDRVCTKTCILGDKDDEHIQMNPGDAISIPIVGFHYDPEYFDQPYIFNPERFSDENKQNIKPFTYMPFGLGPRNCIGSRFALMEAKAIFYHLLSNFTFQRSPKTMVPINLKPGGFQLHPKGGFWLNFVPRKR